MTMAADKQDKVLNVPTLRFPEYSDKWLECELQDIADLSKGAGISKDQLSETGESCILYGELYTKYKSEVISNVVSKTNIESTNLVRSKANDVIIPSSGETAIDISTARCVPYDNILLGGDLNIIRLKDQDGRFFSYQLNGVRKLDIAQIAQGVSVVHLYGESLKRLKVRYPSKSEQEKISSLLSVLDERIETQNRIIDKLQSLMKGLAEHFTAFTPNIKIADCLNCHSSILQENQVKDEGKYKVYGANGICGYSDSPAILEDTILIVKDGSGVGNVSYASGEYSVIGTSNYLTAKSGYSLKYLYYCLMIFNFVPYRTGMAIPHIYFKDYGKALIYCPSLDKQIQIATLLSKIECKIEAEKTITDSYQQQKRFLLQSMFI
jgi:type I restriction enzyme S subunit